MKKTSIILFLFALLSCSSNKNSSIVNVEQNSRIDSILVTYFRGNTDTFVAITCEKIANIQSQHRKNIYSRLSQVTDTFIVDSLILSKVEYLLEKNQRIPEYRIDARMYVTIKYDDDSKENICIGMNTPKVLLNGNAVLLDNELIYLLRKYSGYYRWFSEKELLYLTEYTIYSLSTI